MDEYLDKLGRLSHSAAQRLHVRSALNPILWLCAIATPTIFFFAYLFREQPSISTTLLVAGLVPVGVACLGFAYFALAKPEKLQSEDYQIRHESLQIIQQKGRKAIALDSIEAIANPAAPRLTDGRGE
ncbi:MAG: hypothetical protein AB2799_14760 [Candidatus Thiodiazotropha sp.]